MKTTDRFENAIQKLYTAFHSDILSPECCRQCAVGNLLDHKDSWKHLSDRHGSTHLNYVGKVHEMMGRRFGGYLPSELLQIEAAFLSGCGYSLPLLHDGKKPNDPTDKETLFEGLCAAVSCLCQLDDIQDIMDCSQLFEFEKPSQPQGVLST
ncbi:MAG: Na(+)-translocating NADH-quinone reductase subunit F [Bacteroidota bacterium]